MILIVEDNLQNAELLRIFLERKGGFHSTISTDGDEAIRLCASGAYSLVIMDIQLHNTFLNGAPVSGIELTQKIKSDSLTKHIKVILTTAHAMREEREHFLQLSGADGYFTKPVENYDFLIEQLKQIMKVEG